MAELGIAASIVGLLGVGAKLSVSLFEFASSVGSAERDLYAMGKEVSLFCTVLEQLQDRLDKKSHNFSTAAIKAVQSIVDHCQEAITEIDAIVNDLIKSLGPEHFPSMDFVKKVKWTFKRPKVQVLRATLESCKLTLHIMLTTGEIARKVSSVSNSKSLSAQITQDRLLVQSLYLSQQSTIYDLGILEDQSEKETSYASKDNPAVNMPTRKQRASIWLQALIPYESNTPAHPGVAYRRLSSVDASLASAELIEKWTMPTSTSSNSASGSLPMLSTKSPFAVESKNEYKEQSMLGRASTDLTSPTTTATTSAVKQNSLPNIQDPERKYSSAISHTNDSPESPNDNHSGPEAAPAYNTNKAYEHEPINIQVQVSTQEKVVSSSKTVIDEIARVISFPDSASISLAVVYGGKVRDLNVDDRPFEVIHQLRELELSPFLVLKTSVTSHDTGDLE